MTRRSDKSGLKAYVLAEACGVKPRVVLEAARALGIPLQNRLTRVSAADAERIRRHLQPAGPSGNDDSNAG